MATRETIWLDGSPRDPSPRRRVPVFPRRGDQRAARTVWCKRGRQLAAVTLSTPTPDFKGTREFRRGEDDQTPNPFSGTAQPITNTNSCLNGIMGVKLPHPISQIRNDQGVRYTRLVCRFLDAQGRGSSCCRGVPVLG